MNAQIATAVEQQGAVSEDINRSIINIRDAADTNVQTGQNNLQSAKSVAQLTSALSELAKQFWENEDNAFQYLDRDNLLYHRLSLLAAQILAMAFQEVRAIRMALESLMYRAPAASELIIPSNVLFCLDFLPTLFAVFG
jgi:hypothetical protein